MLNHTTGIYVYTYMSLSMMIVYLLCCRLMYCDVHGVGTYISWVPVVGGSLGVVVGGYISDTLVKRWDNKARIAVLVVSTVRCDVDHTTLCILCILSIRK